jgi:putative phage-type endonuclease
MTITELAGAHVPAAGPVVLGQFVTGSPEWHAARRWGVGGSEIAAVMGLSPYESAFSLWHRKQGLVSPVEENPQMYWGTRLEPSICAEFALRHPERPVVPSATFAGRGRPWQIANPDRLILKRELDYPVELLEAKTARDDEGWGEECTDDIPVHYRAQCIWYLDVFGLTTCRVAVLIAGSDYREYVVTYNEPEALLLRKAGEAFARTVRNNIRPAIDGHSATYQAIRELPDGQDDYDVEISPELRDRFHAAQDASWAAEDELTECKSRLLDAIGTGKRANVDAVRVATRTVRNGRTYSLMPARTRRTAR